MGNPTLIHVKMKRCGDKAGKFLLVFTLSQHYFCSINVEFQVAVFNRIHSICLTSHYLYLNNKRLRFLTFVSRRHCYGQLQRLRIQLHYDAVFCCSKRRLILHVLIYVADCFYNPVCQIIILDNR